MIKLNVLNMKEFLKTVNGCVGAVNILHEDGSRENINGQEAAQLRLQSRYIASKQYLPISLEIPTPSDYMSIVSFYIGDC